MDAHIFFIIYSIEGTFTLNLREHQKNRIKSSIGFSSGVLHKLYNGIAEGSLYDIY